MTLFPAENILLTEAFGSISTKLPLKWLVSNQETKTDGLGFWPKISRELKKKPPSWCAVALMVFQMEPINQSPTFFVLSFKSRFFLSLVHETMLALQK